jgi:hypothetical protein
MTRPSGVALNIPSSAVLYEAPVFVSGGGQRRHGRGRGADVAGHVRIAQWQQDGIHGAEPARADACQREGAGLARLALCGRVLP